MNYIPLGKGLFCLFFILYAFGKSYGQYPLAIETDHHCTYLGEPIAGDLYEFTSSEETSQAIARIMSVMGLKARFEIKAVNIENAAAVIYDNKRYILYSQHFMSQMQQACHTDWAAISILAHEIGHHLNGHTLLEEGSRPSNELEADEFSGFILHKMGATLTEAQVAISMLAEEKGSLTHPPKRARLEAIAVGWERANDGMVAQKKSTPTDNVRTNTTSASSDSQVAAVQPIDSKYLLGKVIFNSNPENQYFLTTQMDLIKTTGGSVKVIGKLIKSNREEYPFMIYNMNKNYIYIASNGEIYNASKQKIGYTVDL